MDDPYKTRKTLIQRLKENRDEQSWEEFLQTYKLYIYSIIRRMNIYEHDADDIAQQVMLKVWKGIAMVDNSPAKPFRNWLGTVTANCVKDFMRKSRGDMERVEKAAQDETISYLKTIELPDIHRIAEEEWEIHLANLAMERIEGLFSGKAIQVFMMSLEGEGVASIARKMELKENSVYRLKNRVKERLAEEIKQLREELE